MLPMTISQFLSGLRAKGVSLSLADGELKVKGDASVLSAQDRQGIEARRNALLLYFAAHAAVRQPALTPAQSPPLAAESQQSWWGWVRESPFPLPHERISSIETFSGVDPQQIDTAIKKIITRHATLRSTFRETGGKLGITLNLPETFACEFQTIEASVADAEESALQSAKAFNEQFFPVDSQWLVKVKIISTPSQMVVALLLNHILIDGISLELIRAELEDILSGRPTNDEPPQFIDYAQWEQNWIQGPNGLALIDYWHHWLKDQPDLRTPSGRLLEWRHGRNVNCLFFLSPAVRERINARAIELKSSQFFLYLALYAVALGKWSGQDRFSLRCIGDLRRSRTLAPVVGFMTCADPIEVQIPAGGDFSTLLKFISAEYYNAAMLRLPSMLKFPAHPERPGIEAVKYTEAVAATINYMPDRKRSKPEAGNSKPEAIQWPPIVKRYEPEDWPALLWPIYLRLSDSGDKTIGLFQFNEEIVPLSEQDALISCFFAAIEEHVGGFL